MGLSRREFMIAGLGAIAFKDDALNCIEAWIDRPDRDVSLAAMDEDFWMQIQQAFTLDRTMINLNNGGVCPSPRVVQDAFRRYIEYSNQGPTYFMWRHLEPAVEAVRQKLAGVFGCDTEEIALTRNASEALEILILGLQLGAGDEVLTTDLDYPRMLTTIDQRVRREGVKLVQIEVPHKPKRLSEYVDAFERAITPKTKMILFSQISFLNGQIFPSAEICKLGEKHGIPVIVDGAHAFAQIPVTAKSAGCEFYGCSLHKWTLAPIGTGFLYVKQQRIKDVWPLMAATKDQVNNIRKFEEIGTHPAANHNAISEALSFHELIGQQRKTARLRYLRSRWTEPLQSLSKVQFHTNLDPMHSCALCTVGIEGIEPAKLSDWLWNKYRIFVTTISQPRFAGIRVSANVYTTLQEIDTFTKAMTVAATQGIN